MIISTRFINTGLPSGLAFVVGWVEKMECKLSKESPGYGTCLTCLQREPEMLVWMAITVKTAIAQGQREDTTL